jgi:bisphosphoglycerate-dependent phosphoglycerate mutase
MEDNQMLDELYRQKYLKYKSKYLELRDQSGGIDPQSDDKEDNEIRFQNCAIFKLRIRNNDDNDNVTLDLIYTGKVTKKIERKYYISPFNENNVNPLTMLTDDDNTPHSKLVQKQLRSIKKEHDIQNDNDKKQKIENHIVCTHNTRLRCFIKKYFKETNINEEYFKNQNRIIFATRKCKKEKLFFGTKINKDIDIYIVRHGEGVHNDNLLKKVGVYFSRKLTDALLTKDGIDVATNAGTWLKNYMGDKTFTKLFASKLQRTRQTLAILLEKFSIDEKIFIIVPCSHELQNFVESGECDKADEGKRVYPENTSKCADTEKKQGTQLCTKNFNYTNNWTFYNIFYRIGKKDRFQCRNTNFINQIIEILSNNYTTIYST